MSTVVSVVADVCADSEAHPDVSPFHTIALSVQFALLPSQGGPPTLDDADPTTRAFTVWMYGDAVTPGTDATTRACGAVMGASVLRARQDAVHAVTCASLKATNGSNMSLVQFDEGPMPAGRHCLGDALLCTSRSIRVRWCAGHAPHYCISRLHTPALRSITHIACLAHVQRCPHTLHAPPYHARRQSVNIHCVTSLSSDLTTSRSLSHPPYLTLSVFLVLGLIPLDFRVYLSLSLSIDISLSLSLSLSLPLCLPQSRLSLSLSLSLSLTTVPSTISLP